MKKAAQGRLLHEGRKNYFLAASEAALVAASAEEAALWAAPVAAEAESAAAEAAPVAAAAAAVAEGASAGAGTTTTGAGAPTSSFLPHAARARAATMAAKTRDLFIFTILDELRKQFPETVKKNPN